MGSAADRALDNKVNMAGANQSSRTRATAGYDAKVNGPGGRYQTQGFTSEPATRPSYVPQTTVDGGVSHTIVFVPGYGYGYRDPFGVYVPYGYQSTYYGGGSGGAWVLVFIIVLLVVVVVVLGIRRSR